MSKSSDLCSKIAESEGYKTFEASKKDLVRSYDSLKDIIENYIIDSLSTIIRINVPQELSTPEKIKLYLNHASGKEARKLINGLDRSIQKHLPELYEDYKISDYLKKE